jgi:oligopeptide transport system permease protein
MTTFVIRRVIWTIPVILLVIFITFMMMRQIGGNPFRKTERAVPASIQRNLDEKFHVNDPWWKQYGYYVRDVFTINFGPSLVTRNRTVNDIISDGFPRSVTLGVLAFAWALAFGVPAGIISALRPNSIFDYGAQLFSNLGFAVPNFLVGTLLIYFIALKAGLVPTNGWGSWKHTVLPSFALGLLPMAYFARLVRGTMLVTLQQDYVRTARAKGLGQNRVIGLHVFRNSLIPVVTAAGPLLGFIITGSFIIETVFSIPGIGRAHITAVQARDYSVVMGLTVVISLIVILANLVVDILYGILDPRTREAR